MDNINEVSIKIKTGVYGQFRSLNNKVWFALGEYVDNAVQSFLNNKAKLIKINRSNYQFEVRINIDWKESTIKIWDNAAGIDINNFQRAFEPANIPIDNLGLNEFGMGMKTASIWLADYWSVRSAALDETIERHVEFDLKKVLKEEREELKVKSTPKSTEVHFTEIYLHQLSKNAPSIMQMDKIKRHLGSIYRKFIRSGEMALFINDERLIYEEPEILKAPYYKSPNGENIEWKKEINFIHDEYRATGFIAILSTMSTNGVNGLSLFRRGRVVEGSHDEKYRPKSICGQIGSPRYKRIFGELELEGFSVSFNKSSFLESDDLESLMELMQKEISSKKFDLYNQAEKYIKPKSAENNKKVAKDIVKTLKLKSTSEEFRDRIENSLNEIENESINSKNQLLYKTADVLDTHEDIIELKDKKYRLAVLFINEPSITDLYSIQIGDQDSILKEVSYTINLSHPFFSRFDKLRNQEDYQPIVTIIRSLVLAELIAPDQGTRNAGNIRVNFNSFLRNI